MSSLMPITELAFLDILNTNFTKGGLSSWIDKNNTFLLRYNIIQKSFEISHFDKSELLYAIAYDCNRFAMAAVESLEYFNTKTILEQGIPWSIIRVYYSTYFAAHAIIRIFGRSSTYINQKQVRKLKDRNLDNQHFNIQKGTCSFFFTEDNISITHYDNSHKALWNDFHSTLVYIKQNIEKMTASSSIKLKIMEEIENIQKAIGNGDIAYSSWLSDFRNAVNYQHSHEVWYPTRLKNRFGFIYPKIKYIKDINCTFYNTNDNVMQFFKNSLIVLRFFLLLFEDLKIKNNTIGKLFKHGYYKFFLENCT